MKVSDKIKCPSCDSTERFSITATTSVFVGGDDYLSPTETGSDVEYDSGSVCVCAACGFSGLVGEFLVAALPPVVNAAKDRYETDEVRIDNDADVREAKNGYWVAAWVWVPELLTLK